MKVMIRKPTQVKVFHHNGTRERVEEIRKYLNDTGALVVANNMAISIHLIDTVLYLTPDKYLVIDEGNQFHIYDQTNLLQHFDEVPVPAETA